MSCWSAPKPVGSAKLPTIGPGNVRLKNDPSSSSTSSEDKPVPGGPAGLSSVVDLVYPDLEKYDESCDYVHESDFADSTQGQEYTKLWGLKPRVYKCDMACVDKEEAETLLQQMNSVDASHWTQYHPEGIEDESSVQFKSKFPVAIHAPSKLRTIRVEFALPTSAPLNRQDMVKLVHQLEQQGDVLNIEQGSGEIQLVTNPEIMSTMLDSNCLTLNAKDRRYHGLIVNARIVQGINTTGVDFSVRLETPVYNKADNQIEFESSGYLKSINAVCFDEHKQPMGTFAELHSLPNGVIIPSGNDSCVNHVINVDKFNSPEASRWRMVDLQAIMDELAPKINTTGEDLPEEVYNIEYDFDIYSDSEETRYRLAHPKTLTEWVIASYGRQLYLTYSHIKSIEKSKGRDLGKLLQIGYPTPQEHTVTKDGEEIIMYRMLIRKDALDRFIRDHLEEYGPHRHLDNFHLMRLVLEPKYGTNEWTDAALLDRKNKTHIKLRVTVEITILPMDIPIQKSTEERETITKFIQTNNAIFKQIAHDARQRHTIIPVKKKKKTMASASTIKRNNWNPIDDWEKPTHRSGPVAGNCATISSR